MLSHQHFGFFPSALDISLAARLLVVAAAPCGWGDVECSASRPKRALDLVVGCVWGLVALPQCCAAALDGCVATPFAGLLLAPVAQPASMA